jgi:hypothetical protein
VLQALARKPERKDWHDCFLACVYGEKGELIRDSIIRIIPLVSRSDTEAKARLLGISVKHICVVVCEFDGYTEEFLELVNEWLELNTEKKCDSNAQHVTEAHQVG